MRQGRQRLVRQPAGLHLHRAGAHAGLAPCEPHKIGCGQRTGLTQIVAQLRGVHCAAMRREQGSERVYPGVGVDRGESGLEPVVAVDGQHEWAFR